MIANRVSIRPTTALIAGSVVSLIGIAVLIFVIKGFGDLLFPQLQGITFARAVLYQLVLIFVDGFLFFEGYRLLKAATASFGTVRKLAIIFGTAALTSAALFLLGLASWLLPVHLGEYGPWLPLIGLEYGFVVGIVIGVVVVVRRKAKA